MVTQFVAPGFVAETECSSRRGCCRLVQRISGSSSRLLRGELCEIAKLAVSVGGAFVWTFTNPGLGKMEFVDLATHPAEKVRRPVRRYKLKIIARSLEAAVEGSACFVAAKDQLAHCAPRRSVGYRTQQCSRLA
jgi:hypothetical protein